MELLDLLANVVMWHRVMDPWEVFTREMQLGVCLDKNSTAKFPTRWVKWMMERRLIKKSVSLFLPSFLQSNREKNCHREKKKKTSICRTQNYLSPNLNWCNQGSLRFMLDLLKISMEREMFINCDVTYPLIVDCVNIFFKYLQTL